jgi:hypothetical protein
MFLLTVYNLTENFDTFRTRQLEKFGMDIKTPFHYYSKNSSYFPNSPVSLFETAERIPEVPDAPYEVRTFFFDLPGTSPLDL